MSRITKNELISQLAAQGRELEAARLLISQLRADVERLSRQPVRTSSTYREACSKAKALAMHTGRSVKVAD